MNIHETSRVPDQNPRLITDEQKKKFYEGLMAALLLITAWTSVVVNSSREEYQSHVAGTQTETSDSLK